MPDVPLSFSRDEYAIRLERTRAAMAAAELDVLITVDRSNMAWLTGYDGWSFYVHQAVIVAQEGEPLWWGRRMDAQGALRTVYMAAEAVVEYTDDYVMNAGMHAMTHLAETLAARGLARGRIGVELDNYYYSAKAHAVLDGALPEAQLIDATGLVNWQRGVKSAQELIYIERAARIVERMHSAIQATIEPGMRKNDLVAEIVRTGIAGTDEFGGDYPAIVPLVPTGIDATAAHLTWDDRPFERGAVTFFEIAGCHRRYHAPLCRSAYLGTPPSAIQAAEEAVLAGLQAGIAAARAGNVAGDVARAFHGELAKRGIERTGRCGYPIGLSYPPDWGERTVSFRETDGTPLTPGMTFHFMPGLWMDEWGIEITESIVIEPDGPARTLTQFPRGLFVKS